MDYSESLALEYQNKFSQHIFINEGNIKARRLNKNIKAGKSFQYSCKMFLHRFIAWSIENNVIKITEYSTDFDLLGNQLSIEFEKSQIISLNVFENGQTVDFLISTSISVVRFYVHHPSKLRQPNKENNQYSIFYGINDINEIKHYIVSYFDVSDVTANNSILDYGTNNAYFNFAVSSGSIFTIVIAGSTNTENIFHFEMKEMSLLSKIFSGFMPKQKYIECFDISIIDMTYVEINKSIYLISISRDNKIRIWNIKDRSCSVTDDLLQHVLESNKCSQTLTTINQNTIISSHKIKSFYMDTNINDYIDTVVIYFHTILGKNTLNNWLVYRIMDPCDKNNCNQPIQLCSNINNAGENLNLHDFEIGFETETNDIIGVWSLTSKLNDEKQNIYGLNWEPLIQDSKSKKVTCRLYNATNELDLTVLEHQDAQEAVLTKIFSPHNFSKRAIINTINRYNDGESDITYNISVDELQYKLVIAVESQIERQIEKYLSEDCDIDLIELNRKLWFDMFHEIVQEHSSIMEPLSIILNPNIVGLNRLGTISLMRRSNGMDQILSGSSIKQLNNFFDENIRTSGCTILKYIHNMAVLLKSINGWPMIENKLFSMCISPIEICHQLSSSSLDISSINSHFDNHPNLFDQTVTLLEKLDIESFEDYISSDMHTCVLSSLSMDLLHYSTSEVIRQRICASLSLLIMLTQRSLNSPQSSHFEKLVDRIACLINSLISVNWLLSIRHKRYLELTDIQKSQLISLNLLEYRYQNSNGSDILCIKVLQLMQPKFKMNNYKNQHWQSKIAEEITMIVNHLYPNRDGFPLIEICKYFLSYNMPIELIDFLKMLIKSEPNCWWEGDVCFVNAMIGISYLLLNKPWKAVDFIVESITKLEILSSMLPDIILSEELRSEMDSIVLLQIGLLMKFIEVVENIDNPQAYIILLAKFGLKIINEISESNTNIIKYKSILMTILFKNLLELKKYNEARMAILENPNVEKQKDCLRQFVMVLCEHGQLTKLIEFSYDNLNEEFVNIITCRARAWDPTNSSDSFYNVLYSFHIRHGDIKAAATSMLELALRLDNDMKNRGPYIDNSLAIEILQSQIKAYLTCITSSSLLSKDEQLFVFPAKVSVDFKETNISKVYQEVTISDTSMQSMELCEETMKEEGTDRNILNLSQIKRQYSLIKSRLKLLRESPEHGFVQCGKLTPVLTLTGLLQLGLYADAIIISMNFNLEMSSIINTIATRCAQISTNCLDCPLLKEKENVIDSLEEIVSTDKNVDFASFGSLQRLLWKLLEEVLEKYDLSSNGDLYIKASSKLLSSGIEQLPSWMVNNIVSKNSHSSLIKLYISNGLLEQAVNLACRVLTERIDEIHNLKDNFNDNDIKRLGKVQTKWLSYPILLNLLDILFSMKNDYDVAQELFDKLNDKFKTMLSILQVDNAKRAIKLM